jgi:hypothetical protein
MLTDPGQRDNDDCTEKAHYWVIDDKNLGVCKRCGAQKQFPTQVFGWQSRKAVIDKALHGTIH